MKDRERIYAKNPNYYVPGKPYMDGLDVIVIPDTTAQAAALRTKKLDVIATVQDMADGAGAGEVEPEHLRDQGAASTRRSSST